MTQVDHNRMANAIRGLAMDAVEKAKSGHPGLPMGAADMATVLFTQFLKFDASATDWPDRDRFVLSAGHGSMLLYALLYLTGNAAMTLDQIKQFRQLGSLTPGHPENFHTKGIETTTGPLGQGISTAVGMALAEKMLAAEFGKKIVEHSVWEQRIGEARTNIEMTRLLCLKAADMMDKVGNKTAQAEIAMIKVAAPNMALKIIDQAIQAFGGGGVSDDAGLAKAYAHIRTLRLADGPDEVHNRAIARLEVRKYANTSH